jgi:hypothetical protein
MSALMSPRVAWGNDRFSGSDSRRGSSVPKTALILSSGRTGTQFLAHFFDANFEGVVARHEPPPSRWLRFASHAYMRGNLSRERLRSLLAYKRRHYDASIDAALYIESNPFLVGFADVIGEVWDAPTIIHVVRDPREHARSSLNHGTGSGLKGLANRFVPFWYPDVRRILPLDHRPSWLERAAGIWTIGNRLLIAAAPGYPDYHRFAYESIFDAEHSGLREICHLLGLDFPGADAAIEPEQRINRSRTQKLPPWREWSPAQCRALDQICSPLMGEFGYGNEPEWRAMVASDG